MHAHPSIDHAHDRTRMHQRGCFLLKMHITEKVCNFPQLKQ